MGFTYNQDAAMKAGGTAKESGSYIGHIKSADYKRAKSGSSGLELSFETKDGSEFNYLTMWYQKQDGSEIKGGSSMISAIMGLCNVHQLSEKQVGIDQQTQQPIFTAPELIGKDIGLLLQKAWYTKGDGSDGYKFEIRLPFNAKTKQTLKEQLSNAPAEMVERTESTMVDKDERTQQGNVTAAKAGFGQQPNQQFGQITGQPAPQPENFGERFDVPNDTFGN